MNPAKIKFIPAPLLKSLMSAIVDSALDAIISVDENQRIILFNAAAERMFQCPRQEALGQKLDRFMPERHRTAHRQGVENFGHAGKTPRGSGHLDTVHGLRANGEEFPLEASFSQVAVNGKKIYAAILRDVTERLRAEESHARLAAIVEFSNDAIIGINLEGIVTSWNDRAEKIFGYSRMEMVGQTLASLIPSDRRDEREQILRRVHCGHVKHFDTVRRCKDGRLIEVSIMVSPIKDVAGQVTGTSWVARDITASKRAELELRRREEYFRSLIEYASDLITLLDESGIIHFQSPSVGRILNYQPEELAGRNISEFVHPEDWPRLAAMIRRALANSDSPVSIECRVRHHDGGWHLFASVGRSLPHGTDGKRVVFNSRDITASRNLEEQLLQAQKMEAIGTLSGGIAHDFNNMLTVVIGSLDAIARRLARRQTGGGDDGEFIASMQRSVELATQGAEKAAQLTHRLLAFARRQPLAPKPTDLNLVIRDRIDLLRRTIGEAVDLETVFGGGLWLTSVDQNQLENVLVNLVINARDAMPEGGKLTVETANAHLDDTYVRQFGDVAAGQYVLLSVTDTGVGMTNDLLQRVFEPFFTTKKGGTGSGLGLPMVHGFVKQSGGHIRIYSEIGQGTAVKLYLPRNLQLGVTATPAARPLTAEPMPRADRDEAILVVEDSHEVRQFAKTILEDLGYAVVAVVDGLEAVRTVRSGARFDLLFTDVVLSVSLNGRELAQLLREGRPDLPVLYTTGYTRNAIVHNGRLDADVDFIQKPYSQRDLALKLRELLDRPI